MGPSFLRHFINIGQLYLLFTSAENARALFLQRLSQILFGMNVLFWKYCGVTKRSKLTMDSDNQHPWMPLTQDQNISINWSFSYITTTMRSLHGQNFVRKFHDSIFLDIPWNRSTTELNRGNPKTETY